MKTYRRLRKKGSKEPLLCHFNTVVASVERVLGTGSTDPSHYGDADLYAEKYLSYNLRRKEATSLHNEVSPETRRAETLTGFLQRELLNRRLNETRTYGYDPATGEYKSDELGLRLLYDARGIIADILRQSPDLDRIAILCDFGNGASATLRRSEAQRPRKFGHKLSVTRGLLVFAEKLINTSPAWSALLGAHKDTWYVDRLGNTSCLPERPKVISGGVLDFVPKTAEIDRIIIKEPELNGFVQKGIGREMRQLLRMYRSKTSDGVDLNTSGDLNSDLARAGSLHGHIGTVDGERASDSITLSAVEFLLPEGWAKLISVARSPYCLINGKWHRLQMVSGMGNGFTFELESIIFYAIGLACARYSKYPFAEKYVSIHGDDLTVPADVMVLVREAYAALGITVNKSKSFGEGPFRESCGGHWFNGLSVKPFYVKTSNGLTRGDWFWLANSLFLWLSDRSPEYLRSKKGQDLLEHLAYVRDYSTSYSRAENRFRIPFDRSRRAGIYERAPCSTGAWYRCLLNVDVPRTARFTDAEAYVAWLHSPQVSPSPYELLYGSSETDPYGYNEEVDERVRWTTFSRWDDVCNGPGAPYLWAYLDLHKGRRF